MSAAGFTDTTDGSVVLCDHCGALVARIRTDRHARWHKASSAGMDFMPFGGPFAAAPPDVEAPKDTL